jgi:hypothetical protein
MTHTGSSFPAPHPSSIQRRQRHKLKNTQLISKQTKNLKEKENPQFNYPGGSEDS